LRETLSSLFFTSFFFAVKNSATFAQHFIDKVPKIVPVNELNEDGHYPGLSLISISVNLFTHLHAQLL